MFATDHTGEVLDGKYELERLLGEGGMGSVYLGRHLLIGKKLAVKFLHAEFKANEEAVKRFYREAQAAAAIGHRNIVDVVDVGVTPGGEPYLVMEYLEGESLADILERRGSLSLAQACGVLEPTLIALSAAHDKSVVHRDLKPDNIFLVRLPNEAPIIKLIDFGISKFTGPGNTTKLTREGTTLGTPAYMSPEQARGAADVDHLCDIYSMGVIFYEVLTGTTPFGGESYNELLFEILTGDPRDPVEMNPGFPRTAGPVIDRAMARDPKERYQNAAQMLAAIRELVATQERLDGLTSLGEGMLEGVISGDLGETIAADGDTQLAAEILSAALLERRAGPLARVRAAFVHGPRRRLYRIAAAAVACLFLLLMVIALATGPEAVTIELVGLPSGARVYYEDSVVPSNPFTVEHRETIVPLRVEAEGFADFKLSVTPSENRRIDIEMDRLPGKKTEKAPQPTQVKPEDTPSTPTQPEETSSSGIDDTEKKTPTKKSKKKSKNPFKSIKLPWN